MAPANTTTKPPDNGKAMAPVINEKTVMKVNEFRNVLTGKGMMEQLVAALPSHLKKASQRYARSVLTEMQRNWQLSKCTAMSIMGCMIQAAQLGLEIGGPLGQAYMVPYGNKRLGKDDENPNYDKKEAQFQIGYRGLAQLAFRSGQVKAAYAHVVYTKDKFKITLGTSPKCVHEPFTGGDRGAPIGVYAAVHFVNGGRDFEYMTRNEIEKHRDNYSKSYRDFHGKVKPDSPWVTAWEEMWKKTPFRRLMKRCPLTPEAQHMALIDEYGDAGIEQRMSDMVQVEKLLTGPPPAAATETSKTAQVESKLDLPEPEFDFGGGEYEEATESSGPKEPPPGETKPPEDKTPGPEASAEEPPQETPEPEAETPEEESMPTPGGASSTKKGGLFADGASPPSTDPPRSPGGRRTARS